MANPGISRAEADRTIAAIHEALRKGHKPPGSSAGPREKMALAVAADAIGLPRASIGSRMAAIRSKFGIEPDWSLYQTEPAPEIEITPAGHAEVSILEALRKGPATLAQLAERIGKSKGHALDEIEAAQARGANIHQFGEQWSIERAPPLREAGASARFDLLSDESSEFRFGFVTDNHLGSKYSRLDVLNDLYDRFAAKGITTVYNAGNWIDGEANFNKHDLLIHGMDAQLRYLAEHYPRRDGLTTYFIAGDDHEGWYAQKHGVDIGRYAEAKMQDAGRGDFIYMGYMEADVRLVNRQSGEHSVMRIVHPGGGSSYAISYSMQKLVESYEGGDKPAVVLGGHYHKQEIVNYRNCWIIQGGTTEDQTPFMRKKKLEAHVGGQIVTLEQDPGTGAMIGCNGMYRYFNRGYYEDRNGRFSMSGDVTHARRTPGGV